MSRKYSVLLGAIALIGAVFGIIVYATPSILSTSDDADLRILFIGNSFTHGNDLPDLVTRTLVAMPEYDAITTAMVAPGGYRIVQHTEDALDKPNTRLREYLVTGSPEVRAWDLVIVQGQSQIMGFPNNWQEKNRLLGALPRLATAINDNNSTLMLYMTWGYPSGDPTNSAIYPDYLQMQSRLQQGYDEARQRLTSQNIPSYVSPIGLAWQTIYQDEVDAGRDPLADLSPFMRLYQTDLRHPSLAGSYLVANMIVASYTGQRVSENSFVPNRLPEDYARYLREVADRVVFEEFSDRDYPFN